MEFYENGSLFQRLAEKKEKLAVVGLGYVGLPLAVAFAKKTEVIGYDLNKEKIQTYLAGKDPTGEAGDAAIRETSIDFTDDEKKLSQARFIIVAVPTPINQDKTPDLSPVLSAAELVGRNMQKGTIVVFESTVYPGVTEDICQPALEKYSGLVCGKDFSIGYSPERINPGDQVHRLENIVKVVSGKDDDTLKEIQNVYNMVIDAGTYPVSNIKTAEAIKVVENSQRDINIAFMNELAMVFDRMGIDTSEVVRGMNTKWNALGFRPGLVGGHCIGVDPYYFVYQAEKLGYHSHIILAGRKVNDGMGEYVANAAIRQMALAGQTVRSSRVLILGMTFKENCGDTRNSRVIDIVNHLKEYGIEPVVADPMADASAVFREYGLKLAERVESGQADCVILAVAHKEYIQAGTEAVLKLLREGDPAGRVVIDVKGILDASAVRGAGYRYWSL